eukprot:CAMPEP_0202763776 /NCGR_PEP_ID=MMETSP1388-20130828/24113_1 /ASSEMBLY_ACC=CAM_ASM_000864 /TAXON_ID=37098 /ORGANISM="Isochrysis sp, Strain CCMP1244" /LENGTH=50 /DNA_ID=CAMNT_0049432159 /DNA_START=12 /DNA_END=161 /DNA_ORIENTATION=-
MMFVVSVPTTAAGRAFRWAGMGVGLQAWVGTLLTPVHALVGRGARAVVRG